VIVRRFRPADAAATVPILYDSSGGMYDRYAGNRELSERVLGRALTRTGNTASGDVIWVAEENGEIAGAMAAMPWPEWTRRAGAFLRVVLGAVPPWRWPRALLVHEATGRGAPVPGSRCLYVDSLATAEPFRRPGVATALLDEAERVARDRGLWALALDTWQDNQPARALYAQFGFREVALTPAARGLPGGVALVKELKAPATRRSRW
jgi:ribosomal protein S18 acetylase RimI-like enzyme